MLRVLFDFVVDTCSNPLSAGISHSLPFGRLRVGLKSPTSRQEREK